MISRRTFLARAAGAAAAGAAGLTGLTGCSRTGGNRLEVAVIWSGGELERFRQVLRPYEREHGPVDVTSAGDGIGAFLSARHRAGNSPDIAILSRPGLVRRYAADGWLAPVPELTDRYPQAWRDILKVGCTTYGVWVKAAHKSLFWRRPDSAITPPGSWEGLVAQVHDTAARAARAGRPGGGNAPLAIGAADGWVLTDWLENLLAARLAGPAYDSLAQGADLWREPNVRAAFGDLFDMWHGRHRFPGGPGRALLTQQEESVLQVFAERTAEVVFEGDFVAGVISRFAQPGDGHPEHFRFPAPSSGTEPLVVGGDAAVLLNDSPRAAHLLRWLTEPDSFAPWLAAGGFMIPNLKAHRADHYADDGQRELAGELIDGRTVPRFDLSDLLDQPFGGADGQGSWRLLQDFFAAATAPDASRDQVLDDVTARFSDAARHYQSPGGPDPDGCP